jgi:phosphoserine phosphatase
VDSTLCGIEGIDWLARRRGPEIAAEVADLTDAAMNGRTTLDTVYGGRLIAVRPTSGDVDALAAAYIEALAPGAQEAIAEMRKAGVRVHLVSGGIRDAILPLAKQLGFRISDVHAVEIRFGPRGEYAGFDPSPLTTQSGKRAIVDGLQLRKPALAVGDGATDMAMAPSVDAFAAYTGFVRRAAIVAGAAYEVRSFSELARLALAGEAGKKSRRSR